jgi:outer membrane lipoprotein SlyB
MTFKKIFTIFLIYTFFLSGCVTNNTRTSVGPPLSSSYQETARNVPDVISSKLDMKISKLDVIIPVFDPGLPEDPSNYDDENIWPELRRAEANRFAHKLKETLEATGRFGAVRVTPDKTATGDLYILGRIKVSNGEEVALEVETVDISGKRWFKESFEHEVSEAFHKDQRKKGLDPYDPVFEETAARIVEELKKQSLQELEDLHYIADLRFGANFSESTFMPYMETKGGRISLVGKPSDDDPMMQRVKAVRVRDQLFIDSLQDNYAAFSGKMKDSYLIWQEQSLFEVQAQRAAKHKATGQAIGGGILIGLAVLSAIWGADSDNIGSSTAGATGAILGGMAGASLLSKSFKTSEEAKVHRDALNELGQSIDMELSPQVIVFEKENVELTGNAKEQFVQWREFLQKIYAEERTPDVQL